MKMVRISLFSLLLLAGSLLRVYAVDGMPQNMSFCIADLKFFYPPFQPEQATLKVLECGEGGRSKFKGYDAFNSPGAMWSHFWRYLANFNRPMWLVSMPEDQELRDEINFGLFTQLGGKTALNITDLEKQIRDYIKARHGQFTPELAKNYEALVLIKKGRPLMTVKSMKDRFPKIVFIGQQSNKYVNNKFRLDSLFAATDELKQYRPKCRSCSVEYDQNLAQSLINEFGCEIFVVKPINSSRGRGIVMVHKNDLDSHFKRILTNREKLADPVLPEELQYWATYVAPNFLVEQYEKSKSLYINNEPYDATMRLVFALDYTHGKLNVTIFDGYWKLPAFPLTAHCSLTDKHKSHVIPGILSSWPIADNDKKIAMQLLEDALRKLYWQIEKASTKSSDGKKMTIFDVM